MPINSFDNYPLTWRPDIHRLKPPYYQSLAQQLEQDISAGLLAPGTMLPPQRELADFLDLNYTTVTRVYNLCKAKGLIYGITGKGTFVSPYPQQDISFSEEQLHGKGIDLAVIGGFDHLHTSAISNAIQSVIQKGFLQQMYTNSPQFSFTNSSGNNSQGLPHQLAAGRRWLEQLGVSLPDEEHLLICSGAQSALTISLISLFAPGDRIATDEYTYSNFIELAKLLHLQLVPISGDLQGMSPELLERACQQRNLKGIYLMPTCANPTTVTISAQRRKELADIIIKYHLTAIEDDISSCFYLEQHKPLLSPMYQLLPQQCVYICSTTKSLSSCLRIAYLAFSDSLRSRLLHGLQNIEIKASSLDAEIITELILSGKAYQMIEKKRQLAKAANALFDTYFPEAGSSLPNALPPYALFRWLPLTADSISSADLEQKLLAQGVQVYHSGHFTQIPMPHEYLRVSLSAAGSMNRLKRGLEILRDTLDHSNSKAPVYS